MPVQPVYIIAQGSSDESGNVVLTFPQIPQSLTYTGTLSITANTNPVSDPNALFVAYAHPLRIGFATWTVFIDGQPRINFLGTQVVTNFQVMGRQQLQVEGFACCPNTQIIATFTGWSDDSFNVAPIGPNVAGSGKPLLGSTSIFNSITYFYSEFGSQNTTVTLVPQSPLTGNFYYLLSYTLDICLSQQSTTTGNRSCTVQLQTIGSGQTIGALNVGTVPQSTATQSTRGDFFDSPICLGDSSFTGINMVTGATGADACKTTATALVAEI